MTGQININKEIRQSKFGWIGHTLRKDDSELCKAALQWNPQGTLGRVWTLLLLSSSSSFLVTGFLSSLVLLLLSQ
jgi:hypothetical protein